MLNTPKKNQNKNKNSPQVGLPSDSNTSHSQTSSSQARKRPSNDDLVDELLQRAGGVSTFHVLFYVAVSSGANCIRAYMNHLIPFLIQKQDYKCSLTEDLLPAEMTMEDLCTRDNICDGHPSIASWEVDYSSARSLDNWIQQFDLMCEPDWKGGLLGTVFYFSWCLALLIIPRQADKVGRRWLFLPSRFFECFLFAAVLWIRDYWTLVGLMVGFGIGAAGRINVGMVYLAEWMPRKHQTMV